MNGLYGVVGRGLWVVKKGFWVVVVVEWVVNQGEMVVVEYVGRVLLKVVVGTVVVVELRKKICN